MSKTRAAAFTARLREVVERAGGAPVVAKACGVTKEAVYGWLSGSHPYPRTIARLCAKLGVSQTWLEDGTEGEAPGTAVKVRPDVVELTDTELADELATLIGSFDVLPQAYEAMALASIAEHYNEFARRANLRAAARARVAMPNGNRPHKPRP